MADAHAEDQTAETPEYFSSPPSVEKQGAGGQHALSVRRHTNKTSTNVRPGKVLVETYALNTTVGNNTKKLRELYEGEYRNLFCAGTNSRIHMRSICAVEITQRYCPQYSCTSTRSSTGSIPISGSRIWY